MNEWNADWFLVGLTAIYVIATIVICWANWASASAAKKQTLVLIRQYKDSTRARIAIRFDRKTATDRQIVLRNVGREHAEKVHLSIDTKFMEGLKTIWPENPLLIGNKSEFSIAPDQEFWFFVGFSSMLDNLPIKAAHVAVDYMAGGVAYRETTIIDFSQYAFLTDVENSRSIMVNGRHLTM